MNDNYSFNLASKAFVKRIYSGLSADGQFKAEERYVLLPWFVQVMTCECSYRSEHNQQVSLRLLEQIKRNPILKQYHNFHDSNDTTHSEHVYN